MKATQNSILFAAPLWKAAFRPFYLLGVIYGLGIVIYWLMVTYGVTEFAAPGGSLALWHGHEMIFGFSGAIVSGFILTALPSWAGTREIDGGKLAFLLALWLGGRVAFLMSHLWPSELVLMADGIFFPAVIVMILPGLMEARDRRYLAILPILALLAGGNIMYHLGLMNGDMEMASWAIRMGLMGIVAKFILAGGFLTSIFTGNILQQKYGRELKPSPGLEYISAITTGLFIIGDLSHSSQFIAGSLAILAALVQIVRFLRWRIYLVLDEPLVLAMQLSYLWFIAAMLLYGAQAFGFGGAQGTWLHAFTVGALSLMMLSLITRVVLHHTGRKPKAARAMIIAFAIMIMSAALRVMTGLGVIGDSWLAASALIWSLSFALYLGLYGIYLIRPSLPK